MHTRNEHGHLMVDIGKGIVIPVDCERLLGHDEVADHVLYMGLHNILMDAHAGVTPKSFPALSGEALKTAIYNEALGLALKKCDALLRGEVRVNATRAPREIDAVAREAKAIAVATLKKRGVKKPTPDEIANVMANPEIQRIAKRRVEELNALPDIDLEDEEELEDEAAE